jgi:hypothetical protein
MSNLEKEIDIIVEKKEEIDNQEKPVKVVTIKDYLENHYNEKWTYLKYKEWIYLWQLGNREFFQDYAIETLIDYVDQFEKSFGNDDYKYLWPQNPQIAKYQAKLGIIKVKENLKKKRTSIHEIIESEKSTEITECNVHQDKK